MCMKTSLDIVKISLVDFMDGKLSLPDLISQLKVATVLSGDEEELKRFRDFGAAIQKVFSDFLPKSER